MTKIIKISITLLLLINIFSIFILTASAADTGLLPDKQSGSGPDCGTDKTTGKPINCGNYSLNDMVGVSIKISEFILGIVGSLSLLAFVAGGLMMMLSAGNPEWVTRGKQTLIGAVIGLTIVFTSFMIIQLVFTSLGVPGMKFAGWSNVGWFGGNSGE